jgi:hypothetical protein
MTAKYSAEWWEKLTARSAGAKSHSAGSTLAEPDEAVRQHARSQGNGCRSESRLDLEQAPSG